MLKRPHNAVVEGTTEAIFIKDLTGRYVLVNAVSEGIMARPRAAILGNDDTAFFPPEIARALMETDQRIIQSGRAETLEGSPSFKQVSRADSSAL